MFARLIIYMSFYYKTKLTAVFSYISLTVFRFIGQFCHVFKVVEMLFSLFCEQGAYLAGMFLVEKGTL